MECKLSLRYAPLKMVNISIERQDHNKIRKDLFHERQFLLVGGADSKLHFYRLKLIENQFGSCNNAAPTGVSASVFAASMNMLSVTNVSK